MRRGVNHVLHTDQRAVEFLAQRLAPTPSRDLLKAIAAVDPEHVKRIAIQVPANGFRVLSDCPNCSRDSCVGDCTPTRYSVESAQAFLERVESMNPPSWYINELLPDEGIIMWHGRPRSMKSLCALELFLYRTRVLGHQFDDLAYVRRTVLKTTHEDAPGSTRQGESIPGVPPQ